MKTLCIDARMLTFSGIGRHLRTVLAEALLPLPLGLTLIGKKTELQAFVSKGTPPKAEITLVDDNSHPYSPLAWCSLARKIPRQADVFWSPHFTVPLGAQKRAQLVVATFHDLYPVWEHSVLPPWQKAWARLLMGSALRTAHTVVCISEFTAAELRRLFLETRELTVIPQSLDPFMRQKIKVAASGTDELTVLYVGNVKPHKNLSVVLRAMELVTHPKLRLSIVGERGAFLNKDNALDALLAKPEVAARTSFAGAVDDQELRQLYSSAAVLIQPSLYEGFGLTPLEAMVQGTPALVSDIPVFHEVYGAAVAYFDPSDAGQLAQKLDSLANNPKAIPEPGELLEKFSLANKVARYRALLVNGGNL